MQRKGGLGVERSTKVLGKANYLKGEHQRVERTNLKPGVNIRKEKHFSSFSLVK